MAAREPGTFRRQFFGGFNRKDVLTYIKHIYSELDQAQLQNEALLQRCRELEDLVQELQYAAASGTHPNPASIGVFAHTPPEEVTPTTDFSPEPVNEIAPIETAALGTVYEVIPTVHTTSESAAEVVPTARPAWVCTCGNVGAGRFCIECGSPPPVPVDVSDTSDQTLMEGDVLRQQYDELRTLVQNLEQPQVPVSQPIHGPVFPVAAEPAAPASVPAAPQASSLAKTPLSSPPAESAPTKVKVQPVKVKVRRM